MSVESRTRSAESITVAGVPSTPYRVLEWVLYAIAGQFILFGVVSSVSVVRMQTAESPAAYTPGSGFLALGGLLLFVILMGFVLSIVSAVALYLDAETVRDSGSDWSPTPWLYAIGGLVFSGLVVLHYLYVRQTHIVDVEERSNWWVVMAASVVGILVITFLLQRTPFAFGGTFSLAGLFMIGLYKDAKHVASHGDGWRPNPPTHFTVALMTSFLSSVIYPLYTLYYLVRRHRSVELF